MVINNGRNEALFPELGFKNWPFAVTPDDYSVTFLSDRNEVREQLDRLVSDLNKAPSSVTLVWGWYGAGKTHILRHFQHLCRNKGIVFSYTEFPKDVRKFSFLNLYQQFARSLDWDAIKSVYREARLKYSKDQEFIQAICPTMPLFRNAIFTFAESPSEEGSDIARQWLSIEPHLQLAVLRKFGISRKIESVDDAIDVLSAIVKLISFSQRYLRLIWVVDEFNNLDEMNNEEAQRQILNALNSVLNHAPNNLSIVLAFGTPSKDSIRRILCLETALLTKVTGKAMVEIPEWENKDEVKQFIRERFSKYRIDGSDSGDYFPFNEEAINSIFEDILEEKKSDKTVAMVPRTVLEKLNLIVDKAEPLIKDGKMQVINARFARETLKNFRGKSI